MIRRRVSAGSIDVVEEAPARGNVGRGETVLVVLDQFLAGLVGVLRLGNLVAIDDIHGTVGSHDRNLGTRPAARFTSERRCLLLITM